MLVEMSLTTWGSSFSLFSLRYLVAFTRSVALCTSLWDPIMRQSQDDNMCTSEMYTYLWAKKEAAGYVHGIAAMHSNTNQELSTVAQVNTALNVNLSWKIISYKMGLPGYRCQNINLKKTNHGPQLWQRSLYLKIICELTIPSERADFKGNLYFLILDLPSSVKYFYSWKFSSFTATVKNLGDIISGSI